jgi:hypothetical protein
MRSLRSALASSLALGILGVASGADARDEPGPPREESPAPARRSVLPPGLATAFGPEMPEEAWIAFHPKRDDGAWFLIDFEWTLVTGLAPAVREEVRAARRRPASPPPVPLPDVGVALHVVRFEPGP